MGVSANHQASVASGEGFESITLRSPDGSTEAEFVPAANMLCCSLRHHGVEILDRGSGVGAYAHHGTTMGIPLLHPWANRLAGFDYEAAGKHVSLPRGTGVIPTDEAGLPIHGVLPALMRWDVDRAATRRARRCAALDIARVARAVPVRTSAAPRDPGQ